MLLFLGHCIYHSTVGHSGLQVVVVHVHGYGAG
jgi:hypothetical protein